jgi:hypothetical protein
MVMGPSEVQAGEVASAALSAEMPVPPVAAVTEAFARALFATRHKEVAAKTARLRRKDDDKWTITLIKGDSGRRPRGPVLVGRAGTLCCGSSSYFELGGHASVLLRFVFF